MRHNRGLRPARRTGANPSGRPRLCAPRYTCQWGRVSERWLLCAGEYQAQGICSRRRLRRALRLKPPSSVAASLQVLSLQIKTRVLNG